MSSSVVKNFIYALHTKIAAVAVERRVVGGFEYCPVPRALPGLLHHFLSHRHPRPLCTLLPAFSFDQKSLSYSPSFILRSFTLQPVNAEPSWLS